ncbi:MAG: hypothetical protein AAGJ38_02455 [Planctomycetota bacterium]
MISTLTAEHLDRLFPRLPAVADEQPATPAWVVTPDRPPTWHRFFDTSPISPSGCFVAVTQVDDDTVVPKPGDAARVVLVDLESGESRAVAETRGWDTQLGAQVQWGVDDHQLLFNDMDPEAWKPFGRCVDPATDQSRRLSGTIYMANRAGTLAASPCLKRIGLTQGGYGVHVPESFVPRNVGLPKDDGVTLTDLVTGESKLAISIAQLVEPHRAKLEAVIGDHAGSYYTFHVKWSHGDTRLMVVVRFLFSDPEAVGRKHMPFLFTCLPDGRDSRLVVPADSWALRGGHHPDWCPDGRVLMNLNMPGRDGLSFVTVNADGTDLRIEADGVPGSGHPTMHPDGKHILTDAYLHELDGDGATAPLRWVDANASRESVLRFVVAEPIEAGPQRLWRVDQHPAWDRTFRWVTFNCIFEGVRSVAISPSPLAATSGTAPAQLGNGLASRTSRRPDARPPA